MASDGDESDPEGFSHTNSPIGPLRAQFGRQNAELTRDVSPVGARQFHNVHKKDNTRISLGVSIAAKNRAMLSADSPKLANHEPLKSSALPANNRGIPSERSVAPPDMQESPRAAVGHQHFDWARRRASVSDVTPVSEIGGGNNHKHTRLNPRRNTTISRMRSSAAHILALAVAEKPLEEHEIWLRDQARQYGAEAPVAAAPADVEAGSGPPSSAAPTDTPDDEGGSREHATTSQSKKRWYRAVSAIIATELLDHSLTVLSDKKGEPSDRFAAAAQLEKQLADNPAKKHLLRALQKRRLDQYDGFLDRLLTELFLTGSNIFHWFTPAKLNEHRMYFTSAATVAACIVFFFMAGSYAEYALQTVRDPAAAACLQLPGRGHLSPTGLTQWMVAKSSMWCFGGHPWQFRSEFLIQWGARYGPRMRSQGYRWLSSAFVHQSFRHLLSNLLLFIALGWQVEKKYGTWRIVLLFWFAAIGGGLFGSVLENGCEPVVGASGGIFGLMGLFIADLIMNFRSLTRPVLRMAWVLAFLIYAIVASINLPAGTSVAGHVGGFVCGLFPAFLFLPRLSHEKWEAVLPLLGAVATLVIYITLPTYFYLHVFVRLRC